MAAKATTAKANAPKAAPAAAKKSGPPAKGAAAPKAAAKGAAAKAAPVVKPAAPVTITLKQLSVEIAEKHDLAKKQADAMLADVFGCVVDHLKGGARVRIGGLGIIEVKNRPARMGRNPATGEQIQIKASKKVAFRAAKELKESI